MGEIRFVGTGETRGYSYLVCKKRIVGPGMQEIEIHLAIFSLAAFLAPNRKTWRYKTHTYACTHSTHACMHARLHTCMLRENRMNLCTLCRSLFL